MGLLTEVSCKLDAIYFDKYTYQYTLKNKATFAICASTKNL